MSLYNDIINLQKDYRDLYISKPKLFCAAYKRENELAGEYNGRQILELLQNADDACSLNVEILYDKNTHELSIINDGNHPFTKAGIESLMLADDSPKSPNECIGNKGLGFRSVITWCDNIKIYSNETEIEFSKEIAEDFLFGTKKKLDEELILDKKIDISQLYKEKHFKTDIIAFPILGMPLVKEGVKREYTTKIILKCKQNEDIQKIDENIIDQLNLDKTILLFLNNIQTIAISIVDNNEKKSRIIKKTEEKSNLHEYKKIIIEDSAESFPTEWNVLSNNGVFPSEYQRDNTTDEDLKYIATIAWQDDLSIIKNNKIRCYFPTEDAIDLPYYVNANFVVDSSRNHVIKETKAYSKNDFLVDRLIELVTKAIEITKDSNTKAEWSCFKFLKCDSSYEYGPIKYFIDRLTEKLETEEIYPSISTVKKYICKSDYKFYSSKISNLLENAFPNLFSNVIKQPPAGYNVCPQFYSALDFEQRINSLSFEDKNFEISFRGDFIKELCELNKTSNNWNSGKKFNLLINSNFEPIGDENKKAYIEAEKPSSLYTVHKPEYVNFEITNSKLNNELYSKLQVKAYLSDKNPDNQKRKLCELIKSFINVDDFDITAIIKEIISRTNEIIKGKSSVEEIKYIKLMTESLYLNFKERPEWGTPNYPNIKFINKNNTIMESNKLYFSDSYTYMDLGKRIKECFENSLSNDEYLLPFTDWGFFDKGEEALVINFFSYFGVNKFATLKEEEFSSEEMTAFYNSFKNEYESSPYKEYKKSWKKIWKIINIEKLMKVSSLTNLLKIIFWSDIPYGTKGHILLEKVKANTDYMNVSYSWINNTYQTLAYVVFQLKETGKFNNYLLDDTNSTLCQIVNRDIDIDFNELKKNRIAKTDVELVLRNLGVKTSLSSFGADYIYNLLIELENRKEFSDGKNTNSIYFAAKDALVFLKDEQKKQFRIPDNLKLYAFKGTEGSYVNYKDVFYFDNNLVPKIFINTHNILNVRKRAGEEEFSEVFGTKNTSDCCIEPQEDDVIPSNNEQDFLRLFRLMKPYILAYRFINASLNEKSKDDSARILEPIEIHLVSKATYTIDNNEDIYDLLDYEFLFNQENRNIVYLKVPDNRTISDLQKDGSFQISFSEIICTFFKLRENNFAKDLRFLISYSFEELKRFVHEERELSVELINDCKKRLKIQDSPEYIFWQKIIQIKNESILLPDNSSELKKMINKLYGISTELYNSISYELIESDSDIENLKLLSSQLGFNLSDLINHTSLNIEDYNRSKLTSCFHENESKYTSLLWEKCYQEDKQELFLKNLNNYVYYMDSPESLSVINIQSVYITDYNNILNSIVLNHNLFSVPIDLNETVEIKEHEELPEYEEYYSYARDNVHNYLLFFPNNLEKLKQLKDEKLTQPQQNNNNPNNDNANTDIEFTEVIAHRPNAPNINFDNGINHQGSDSDPGRKGKKEAGKKAEDLVKEYFIKHPEYKIKKRSGGSGAAAAQDSFHRDMDYYDGNEWRNLEIKKFEGKGFYLTGHERYFGEKNKKHYDIALVNIAERSIKILKDFFIYNDINQSFSSNTKFIATPTEYFISIDID